MNDTAYDGLIGALATAHASAAGLTPPELAALTKALIRAESAFDPQAFRPEPAIGDASRGLLQLLGRTARALGYGGLLGDDTTHTGGLYDPATNLEYGLRLLVQNLQQSRGDVAAAVSAYNAGWSPTRPWDGKRTATGVFVNQPYVDRVLRFFHDYAGNTVTGSGDGGVSVSSLTTALLLGGGLGLLWVWFGGGR